jgi:glycosyltransferase involved in cell wall biosynthesis
MKITFLQAGNYKEAYERFASGGDETYRDQLHTVNFVNGLSYDNEISVISLSNNIHNYKLKKNLKSIGILHEHGWKTSILKNILDDIDPDLFICRILSPVALRWSINNNKRTLPIFPAIFSKSKTIKEIIKRFRFRKYLNNDIFPCLANHSLSASISLNKYVGVEKSRIVPWELKKITQKFIKQSAPKDKIRIFFAGALIEEKGVGDLLRAVALLRDKSMEVECTLAGSGDVGLWEREASRLTIRDRVQLLGKIPLSEVSSWMRDADIVVVGSRRNYSEGIPNTIFEALSSGAVLVASDHPSYANRLIHNYNAIIYKSGDHVSLASSIVNLLEDKELYLHISRNANNTLDALYVGIEWSELIKLFIGDPDNKTDWVSKYSLETVLKRGV